MQRGPGAKAMSSQGLQVGDAPLKLHNFSFWTCNGSRKFACFLILKTQKNHRYLGCSAKITFYISNTLACVWLREGTPSIFFFLGGGAEWQRQRHEGQLFSPCHLSPLGVAHDRSAEVFCVAKMRCIHFIKPNWRCSQRSFRLPKTTHTMSYLNSTRRLHCSVLSAVSPRKPVKWRG